MSVLVEEIFRNISLKIIKKSIRNSYLIKVEIVNFAETILNISIH